MQILSDQASIRTGKICNLCIKCSSGDSESTIMSYNNKERQERTHFRCKYQFFYWSFLRFYWAQIANGNIGEGCDVRKTWPLFFFRYNFEFPKWHLYLTVRNGFKLQVDTLSIDVMGHTFCTGNTCSLWDFIQNCNLLFLSSMVRWVAPIFFSYVQSHHADELLILS